jgi:hypothetical protein
MIKGLFVTIIAALFILNHAKLYQVVAVITPGARYHINELYDGKETYRFWGEVTPVGLRQM